MTGSGGLSAQEVARSRREHGSNALEQQAHSGFWKKVLAGFGDPIIRILLIALAINALFLLRGAPWFETAGTTMVTVRPVLRQRCFWRRFSRRCRNTAVTRRFSACRRKRRGCRCAFGAAAC